MLKRATFTFQLLSMLVSPLSFLCPPAGAVTEPVTPILDTETRIGERLLVVSALSVGSGALMLLSPVGWVRDFGIQNLAWGVIDGAIAGWGLYETNRKRQLPIDAEAERNSLNRILWINAGLDVAYVACGTYLVTQPARIGHGIGVITQGSFLLLFDTYHAMQTQTQAPDSPIPGQPVPTPRL